VYFVVLRAPDVKPAKKKQEQQPVADAASQHAGKYNY